MRIGRRRLLALAGAASLGGLGLAMGMRPGLSMGQAVAATDLPARQRLLMPPLLDTTATGRVALTAQSGLTRFAGGAPSTTWGFNQGFLAPTILMRSGGLEATLDNSLDEDVTVHWHGLLVPGEHDGGPHTAIAPGRQLITPMSLDQGPATLWYHSHIHGATARHVYSGLAGVIHYTDGRDDARGLPSTYGVDDLTLLLQDRRFDPEGRMIYNPTYADILNGLLGNRVLVNGQPSPIAGVPPGLVRLRLVNGSNARIYSLHFNDTRPFHLVGTDGGLLPAPIEMTYLPLAPGERAEILVDFSQGPAPVLMSARGLSMTVLRFAIDDTLPVRISRVPDRIGDAIAPLVAPDGIITRQISLDMGGNSSGQVQSPGHQPSGSMDHSGHAGHASHAGHATATGPTGVPIHGQGPAVSGLIFDDFRINGRAYRMDRMDFEIRRGTIERWIVSGGGGVEHPFHIHGVHFQVESSGGGGPPLAQNSGWKDTVLLSGGASSLIMRFDHEATARFPYMFHCHILEHEDAGMMGQFTVT
ncbi:Multicopper oxidase [Devosia enhydra]|uniref:Multicopper oxidase CueO n=1 Tax=Devosia enhydra TaxID=665118 RepID=A0A1K2I2U2_9HYPH|nr:multicopper oxidase domain-containing protein [Devosia enhydra]SFZ86710.1 Multicopper oxidase [Devosia enhydra]